MSHLKKITPMSVLLFLVTSAAFLAKVKYGFFGGK
ncbi:MAG: hypothetical protein QOF45_905 [Gaiellaceae bacterium]|nr:hypothetical protein [Gaiellaceae bacterium]